MDLPVSILIFLAVGPFLTVLGDHFQFEPNCVPACISSSAPLTDGQPCMCRPEFFPAGCTVSPCGPGEDASDNYVCQCTEYFQPYQCVTLLCDNGTSTYGPSCPSSGYSASYYPSSDYSSSYYPSSDYSSSYYPSQSYSTKYVAPSYYKRETYPSQQYGYSQSSYSSYSSYTSCNNYCVCEPYMPADCTDNSIPPIIGGPPCACNQGNWLTGCTFKPCQSTDTSEGQYFCECTASNKPSFCLSPRCSHL